MNDPIAIAGARRPASRGRGLFVAALLLGTPAATTAAQSPTADSTGRATTPERDLFDVIRAMLGKHDTSPAAGGDSSIRRPVISAVPAVGYTLATKFAVALTGNAAFRTAPGTRLSTVTSSVSYSQNRQFTMPVESSVWTSHNRFNLVGDWRYFDYPQSTYGLGSASLTGDEEPMAYHYLRFYETIQKEVARNLFAGFGYAIDYRWNVSHSGTASGAPSAYAAYGPATHSVSSGFAASGLFDSRDNPITPTRGVYTAVVFRNNLRALGSDANWQSVVIDARTYIHPSAASNNVLAFWSYDWLVLGGRPPYLDLPSTSWDPYANTGRGYIQGRFRGARMVYVESEYRFGLTRNGLLGGVTFVNGQTYSAAPGTRLEAVQLGYGAGLRVKLNKRSRTNIALDYGFGAQGSHGIFVNLGEAF